MFVNFFIASVQKAGTTALDQYLREHPAIQMANVKEIHFFDDETVDWTNSNYTRLHQFFQPDAGIKARGEATPIYTYWPYALKRIKHYNNATKIIVGLRHPSFRAYSHWRMETKRKLETLAFRQAIAWPARDRVIDAPLGAHRVLSYVERGFYSLQIDELFRLFPREQVAFYRTDHLWSEPNTVLDGIQDFLGLDRRLRVQRTYIVPEATWTPDGIPSADRLFLDRIFGEDIKRTAERTGIVLADWLDPKYTEPMKPD